MKPNVFFLVNDDTDWISDCVDFLPAIPARKAASGQSAAAGVQEEYPGPSGAEGSFSRSCSHTALPGPNGMEGATRLCEYTTRLSVLHALDCTFKLTFKQSQC